MHSAQHNHCSALTSLLAAAALGLTALTASTALAQEPEQPPAQAPKKAAKPPKAPKKPGAGQPQKGEKGAAAEGAQQPDKAPEGAPPDGQGGAGKAAPEPGGAEPGTKPPGAGDAPLVTEPAAGAGEPKDATAAAKTGAKPGEQVKATVGVEEKKDDKAPTEGEAATRVAGEPPGTEERPSEVYAEDWWSTARPALELHGYFRARAEFDYKFALNRRDVSPMWPQPADNQYVDTAGNLHAVTLCGSDPLNLESCDANTNMGANMRFRLAPELHISDNVRIITQIDMLDNLVAGSTPNGYANEPGGTGGYRVIPRSGYSPLSFLSTTQVAPQAGVNSTKDSILVKRVWGEYATPIGQVRFGRMPGHWGLGMYENSGDGYDSDWQTTVDALMLTTGIKSWDLYFSFRLDFANEGATTASFSEQQGQPADAAQLDDVDQYVFQLMRKQNPSDIRRDLAAGLPTFNGGAYFAYRRQTIANDTSSSGQGAALGASNTTIAQGYVRRGAEAFIPDLWFQFQFEKFRLELEGIMLWGSIENTETQAGAGTNYVNPADSADPGWKIRQFGLVAESEYRAVEDRLRVQLKFGWSSGDSDVESLAALSSGLAPQLTTDRTYSEFRFHPDYRVDLILFRNILTRVEGAYYFRPSVEYDFFRDPDGQRVGGGAALIWARASEFVATPGHARDLGVELNFRLYYQAKDGVLNDDAEKMGGFFTQLEYGVMFPLDGLGYLTGQQQDYARYVTDAEPIDTTTAQTVRWYLGILF
jgi:uncharacterized protein (TIGR04551 family)